MGFCKEAFSSFADNMNFQYEESVLESKYDDFKYLMQEYRDGILLFELSNKTVWNKASEDTAGLRTFFEGRRDNYVWKPRAVTKSYVCSSKKSARMVKKYLKKDSSDKAILTAVNKDDALGVNIVYKTYEQVKQTTLTTWIGTNHYTKSKTRAQTIRVFIRITKSFLPVVKD